MTGYNKILNTIETQLKKDPYCKTVTEGSIFNIGLEKQAIYPIGHVEIYGLRSDGAAHTYSVAVICMDIVKSDYSNEKDVIQTQAAVCMRLSETMKRGDLFKDKYQMNLDESYEFFRDKYEHAVAGCTLTFSVTVPNEITFR